jgi:transcriptional regulator with XRE-family HTH domain
MEKELAQRLGMAAREARKGLRLTQEKMAERLGVSVEFYGRIERGMAGPSTPVFARIVSVLGVSADALLGLDVQEAEPAALTLPGDPPELLELVPLLCQAHPGVLRVVSALLREIDRMHGLHKPRRVRRRVTKAPAPET